MTTSNLFGRVVIMQERRRVCGPRVAVALAALNENPAAASLPI